MPKNDYLLVDVGSIQVIENKGRYPTANSHYNLIVTYDKNGRYHYHLFSDSDLEKAEKRALNNPEDLKNIRERTHSHKLFYFTFFIFSGVIGWMIGKMIENFV